MPRYNRYNTNRMSLNTADFQPAVFTPIEFTPVEQDYSILERAMAKQEERQEKAKQQRALFDKNIKEARQKLHQDKETLKRFDDKVNAQLDKIQDAAAVLDFQNAYEAGIQAPEEVLDNEYFASVNRNEQYQKAREEQRQRVGKDISKATFDWWDANHQYYDDFIKENDKIVGQHDWDNADVPVKDVDPKELAFTAFKLLSPEKYSNTFSSNKDDFDNYSATTTSGSSSYDKIEAKNILANIKEIVGLDPDAWRGLRQGFQVALNEIGKLEQERDLYKPTSEKYNLLQRQIDDQKQFFKGENGQDISDTEEGWKIYYSRLIADNLFAKGLAYDWREIANKTYIDNNNTDIATTNNQEIGNNGNEKQYSPGNAVKVPFKYSTMEDVTKAALEGGNQMQNAKTSNNG